MCWRQWGSRYAIRAGRNLPDKEFRYLRTVIVTAAVYRGFDWELAPLLLTFRHRAGVRPYTSSFWTSQSPVFLVNSRHPQLCAPRPGLRPSGAPFSRSYGGILPSSFNTVLSSAWVCSTSPPVSVSGTVFKCRCCFPEVPGRPRNPISGDDFRPSSHSGRRRNINPLPIGYGSRPRLRGPANPARINLSQEPLDFRRQRFSRCLSLLMSAFALPLPPACLAADLRWPTERSATAFRRQGSGISGQKPRNQGSEVLITDS